MKIKTIKKTLAEITTKEAKDTSIIINMINTECIKVNSVKDLSLDERNECLTCSTGTFTKWLSVEDITYIEI